jgi:PKD repeat protein
VQTEAALFYRSMTVICALGVFLSAAAGADAATIRVCASGCDYSDVQSAINAAQPGDSILLRAGETFVGHYWLKRKSGTGVITIRSDAPDSELPAPGVRLVPNTRPGGNTALSRLPRLVGRGGTWRTTPIFQAEASAGHYRLQFLQIDGGAQEGYETLLAFGNNSTQTSTSLAPHNLVLDRLYIHGDPVRGQKRCLALDSASTEVLNSYFEHCRHFAEDAQAIAGFNGPGPYRIENNYLEASTMSILFGGADPATPNLVPSDIVIRRNHLTKKTSWRDPIMNPPGSPRATAATGGVLAAGSHFFKVVAFMDSSGSRAFSLPSSEVSVATSGSSSAVTVSWTAVSGALHYRVFRGTSSNGQSRYMDTSGGATTFLYTGSGEVSGTPPTRASIWNVKNALELKNAQRVLIEGNLIEYVWSASQTGYAILFTPRNQDNGAPWTVVQDVTMQYNIVRHVGGGINILGSDYAASTGSQLTRRIRVRHNLFEDVGGSWGPSHFIVMTRGPSEVAIDHNTVFHTNHLVLFDDGATSGFVFTNNLSRHNAYGVFGSGAGSGTNALKTYAPGAVFRRNVLAGGPSSQYPTDNYFPTESTFYSQFVNYAGRDYRLVSTSPYIAAGTDGLPLGADLGTLQRVQAGSSSSSGTTPTTNAPPTAAPGGPYTGVAGTAIAVDGSGSRDSDGSIASYRWSWGDGTSDSTGATPTHVYAQAGTYTIRLTVTDNAGATATASTTATVHAPTTTSAGDIVITAQDVTLVRGHWSKVASSGSPGGQAMASPSQGFRNTTAPHAQPANYFEASFVPAPNTTYRIWLRLRAPAGSGDSVWVQFTGSVDGGNTPLWRAGTTDGFFVNLAACSGCTPSGWGWEDNAWWIDTPQLVRFRSAAPQTVRIQTREDGVQVDQIVLSPSRYMSSAPGPVLNDGTVLTRTAATLTPRDVVLRARDTVVRRGDWVLESDSSAADGTRLANADRGWSTMDVPLAYPGNYAEATFTAVAGVPYRVWLRLSAQNNTNVNDSVWVQYSGTVDGSGQPALRIGSTWGVLVNRERCKACGVSGWGWYASNWWNGQTGTVVFATTGVQTIRIQPREDGVRIDQIVISPDRYRSSAPGAQDNDTTILPY